ncbi:transcription factor CP2-like protein 1 isoform X2 [Bemisia tabaci]|uniref:transcription factor CP2-like protein 1 isoform X2 n=1 Tax=Bemisia tabaci TaxID=7038 RepID=UPI003B28BE7D
MDYVFRMMDQPFLEESEQDESNLLWNESAPQWAVNPTEDGAAKKRKAWTNEFESTKILKLDTGTSQNATVNSTEDSPRETGNKINSWQQVEDLAENLVADLDGSFSGLSVDLVSGQYNISVSQQSPTDNCPEKPDSNNLQGDKEHSYENTNSFNDRKQNYPAFVSKDGETCGESDSENMVSSVIPTSTASPLPDDCRFQYVLAAATSIATKQGEETLTYLNQGQSYEIKLKKLGDLTGFRGKILKSVVRVMFHDRRLQYTEREQMANWRATHPSDRLLEVDLPLSYGICDLEQDDKMINTIEFLWDPTNEVGVYIKVNCISTEFTPKKHGGEKGVPFRIQVETYLQGKVPHCLHAASCQIKVFKLKGADRKHKQDREKILKRPVGEQEKYQPSFECTILSEVPLNSDSPSPLISLSTPLTNGNNSAIIRTTDFVGPRSVSQVPISAFPLCKTSKNESSFNPSMTVKSFDDSDNSNPQFDDTLSADASAVQTQQWLQNHRFDSYLQTFSNFSGSDVLRLSRDDLIQICGLADGIRLYNSLHTKAIAPKLTIYVAMKQTPGVYQAMYLHNLSGHDMVSKLAGLLGVAANQINDIYLQGPNNIHVVISDEVIKNMKDESAFTVEVFPDQGGDKFRLLLKPSPTLPLVN